MVKKAIYGKGVYGRSVYGRLDIPFAPAIYGKGVYGLSKYGLVEAVVLRPLPLGLWVRKRLGRPEWPDPSGVYGIYRIQRIKGHKVQQKLPHYSPTNPRTSVQQANRQKLADAVSAWQALTQEEKNVYNKKTYPRHWPGYIRFISEYLKSN